MRRLGMVVLLAASTACERDGRSGAADVAVRDSAGVSIVEHGSRSVRSAPALGLIEDLRIGASGAAADAEFNHLRDIALGPGGEIYTLDDGDRAVRVFGPDGTLLRSFGRAGGGPGEFLNAPTAFAVAGDSILVVDRFQAYLFRADGRPIRSWRQQLTGPDLPDLLAPAPDGWRLGVTARSHPGEGATHVVRDTLRVYRFGPDAQPEPIVALPSGRRQLLPDGRSWRQWMGANASVAATRDGRLVASEGDGYEVRLLSVDGRLSGIIRADVEPVPTAAGDFEASLGSLPPWAADAARQLGRAGHLPVVGRLVAAADGSVLVERLDLGRGDAEDGSGPTAWDLIGPDGRIQGRLALSARTVPRVLDAPHVYAIDQDELDVHSVVRYRFADRR